MYKEGGPEEGDRQSGSLRVRRIAFRIALLLVLFLILYIVQYNLNTAEQIPNILPQTDIFIYTPRKIAYHP